MYLPLTLQSFCHLDWIGMACAQMIDAAIFFPISTEEEQNYTTSFKRKHLCEGRHQPWWPILSNNFGTTLGRITSGGTLTLEAHCVWRMLGLIGVLHFSKKTSYLICQKKKKNRRIPCRGKHGVEQADLENMGISEVRTACFSASGLSGKKWSFVRDSLEGRNIYYVL